MNLQGKDMSWEQRFSDYRKALVKLSIAVNIFKPNEEENLELEEIDDLLKEGLIKRFEYTHELAWKVLKDYAAYLGNTNVKSAKESTREGLKMGLITDAEEWMAMLTSRNETSLLFDENTIDALFEKILETYYLLLLKFEEKMGELL
jgi:nucleotidyltransferase substrate binding protein (TIGR01987 family)